jgi:hypothetical protein
VLDGRGNLGASGPRRYGRDALQWRGGFYGGERQSLVSWWDVGIRLVSEGTPSNDADDGKWESIRKWGAPPHLLHVDLQMQQPLELGPAT